MYPRRLSAEGTFIGDTNRNRGDINESIAQVYLGFNVLGKVKMTRISTNESKNLKS